MSTAQALMEGLKELKLLKQGKTKGQPLSELIEELKNEQLIGVDTAI